MVKQSVAVRVSSKTKIISHASFLLGIISCSVFVRYGLVKLNNFNTTQSLYDALFWLFPHEIFAELNSLLLMAYSSPGAAFPFLSFAFCLQLLAGIIIFKRTRADLRFIIGCCWALIISILIAVPLLIIYSFRATDSTLAYLPLNDTAGLTGVINVFGGAPKPPVGILLLQVLILAMYVAEAFYLLRLARRFRRRKYIQN